MNQANLHAQVHQRGLEPVQRRSNGCRAHRGHAHPVRPELVGERAPKTPQIGLGGRINGNPGSRNARRHGGDDEDVPAPPLLHGLPEQDAQARDGTHMQVQHGLNAPQIGRSQFLEKEHAGIVHQHIRDQAAPLAPGEHLICRRRQRQILKMSLHLHGKSFRKSRHSAGEFLLPVAHQHQVIPLFRQLTGIFQPHAGAATGN